jgi:hypothetical protein
VVGLLLSTYYSDEEDDSDEVVLNEEFSGYETAVSDLYAMILILFCDDDCSRPLLFIRNCHENEVTA